MAIAALVGLNTGAAVAATGVAVDLGAVQVEDKLLAGQRYMLPTIGVRNPGDLAGTYEMTVMPLEGATSPPSSWVAFEPSRFDLEPGENQAVSVELTLPPNADPGDYETLLAARVAASDEPGAAVGAAAGSRLSFTISPSTLIEGWLLAIANVLTTYAPWTYVIPGAAILIWASLSYRRRLIRNARHLTVFMLMAVFGVAMFSGTAATAETSGSVQTTVIANPLDVELDLHPPTIGTGRFTNAKGTVSNLGTTDLINVVVKLRIDDTGLQTVGNAEQDVGTLQGEKSANVQWRLCGKQPGNYVVVAHAQATSTASGVTFETQSEGHVVTVEPSRSRAC